MKENLIYLIFVILCQLFNIECWFFSSTFRSNFVNYSKNIDVDFTGYLAAFADFNADRTVDIFILSEKNNKQVVDVVLMKKEESKSPSKRINLLEVESKDIRSVIVGDFTGKSTIDVITVNGPSKGPYQLNIGLGNIDRSTISSMSPVANGIKFKSQPLHLDWNADMVGDLFGELDSGKFGLLLGQENGKFKETDLNEKIQNVKQWFDEILFYQFVDVNNDKQVDILLVGKKGKKLVIGSIIKENGEFKPGSTGSFETALFGQPSIMDFNFDGNLEMLIPACDDANCVTSRLIMCGEFGSNEAFNNCRKIKFNTTLGGINYGFVKPDNRDTLAAPDISQISCGDINLNGHKDCFAVMGKISGGSVTKETTFFQLENVQKETFRLKEIVGENSDEFSKSVSQAAIFDLEEDGIPDLLISSNSGLITPLLQKTSDDSYFLKVMVLNGKCRSIDDCPGNRLPYGIPLPGTIVSYTTESAEGNNQLSIDAMCTDSSYSSLQLPYSFFGLGPFANYIEKLFIDIPFDKNPRSYTHSFIVPKTQIVIIPNPLDDTSKWTNKLFLEPFLNRKVIYVAAALLGTMLIVAIIICILQYLELKEDRLEKSQEAQKFHFDAM